ncbi:MAG: GyrI-like domain-containing protein [Thermoflexales bacterium]|nr:GyrI-like domain-containing protein [Thermoflexales bacterium]
MNNFEVRIVTLEPVRVASFHGFGEGPESVAWEKLAAWAKPQGLLDDPGKHRIFGFNNPDPSPASPNYGYEFWITLAPGAEPAGEVKVKEFPGGLYAVARCEAGGNPWESIPAAWKRLLAWCEDSPYKLARHQCLEENLSATDKPEDLVLDLYLPIAS